MWEIACSHSLAKMSTFHSLNQYLLNAFYCNLFVLRIEDTAANKTKIPILMELTFYEGHTDKIKK